MFLIYGKIFLLLSAINLAPHILSFVLDRHFERPLDYYLPTMGGNPFFGPNKTLRGLVGGMAAALLLAPLFRIPWPLALSVGALSLSGDLLTSFIKRRLDLKSGYVIPAFDQIFEGSFPFLILTPFYHLSLFATISLIAIFGIAAYAASWFLYHVLLTKPYESYHRSLKLRARFREYRSCHSIKNPLHPLINLEQTLYYYGLMKGAFKLLGLYNKGVANALDIHLKKISFTFDNLPERFNGYRILFISDLHIDGLVDLYKNMEIILEPLVFDLCLMGGDYRTNVYGSYSKTLIRLHQLLKRIQAKDGVVAIVGNHDCLEIIPFLESEHVRFLLNDALEIRKGRDRIFIAGVDDPYYYGADDLDLAYKKIPGNSFSILLSHSPKIYYKAPLYGASLFLCGHTHNGQVHIPGIGPLVTHSRTPKKFIFGPWEHEGVQGYTSAGVGVSGIPVRFGTRGEMVEITLRKA